MSFASRYMEKNVVYPEFVQEAPDLSLGMVVVIPVYNEPDLVKTLDSLAACDPPKNSVEVLLVINQGEDSPPGVVLQNKETIQQIKNWKQENATIFFSLYTLLPPPFAKKHTGAGMARKAGMDEAIRRFSVLDNPQGLIISLDADTLVDPNYFVEIEKHFNANLKQAGLCIKFKHRIDEITDEHHRKGMQLYERYLHYYRDAVAFTGYPYAIHTVGSAFAVRAEPYIKQGGMNRRQAGEDFYFLHKLSQFGNIGELHSTCVYPSARLSDRVPFGTGPVLQKWLDGDENLNYTYNFLAFQDLKQFFDRLNDFYRITEISYDQIVDLLPISITTFLVNDSFYGSLQEINNNSANLISFKKRFFQYFNAFKILKFINYSHQEFYEKQNIHIAESELAKNLCY